MEEAQRQGAAKAEGAASLIPYSAHEAQNFLTGAKNKVLGFGSDILSFVKSAIANKGGNERLYCGKLPQATVDMIFQSTGRDLSKFNFVISSDGAWHAYKHHSNDTEKTKGRQVSVRPEDMLLLPEVIAHPDQVIESDKKDGQGRVALFFEKKMGDKVVAITGICTGRKALDLDSMRTMKERSPAVGHADGSVDLSLTSKPDSGQTSLTGSIIPALGDGVNTGYPQLGSGQPQDPAQQFLALAHQTYPLQQLDVAQRAQLTAQQMRPYVPYRSRLEALAMEMASAENGKGLFTSEPSRGIIEIGRSLGAKAKNYEVMDLATGEFFEFAEGTKIQDVQVFAGKGSRMPYRRAAKYAELHGGKLEDWQHVKGFGQLVTPDGDRKAEVHWSQCEGIGKFDFFVKEWLD